MLKLELVGICLAHLASSALAFLFMVVKTYLTEEIKDAVFMPTRESLNEWTEYLSNALPMIFVAFLFLLSQEINLILAA